MFHEISVGRYFRYYLSHEYLPDALSYMAYWFRMGKPRKIVLREYAAHCITSLVDFPTVQPDIYACRAQSSLRGVTMIESHGGPWGKTWTIRNGSSRQAVQRWVDQHDGTAFLLILFVCNPLQHTIKAKKSLVLHWNDLANYSWRLFPEKTPLKLYVPGRGYVV